MKKLLQRIYNALVKESDIRSCNGGVHAKLELVHSDMHGVMLFYCRQCGKFQHY